jgi:hypothetical protein
MNMISHTTNTKALALIIANNGREVSMKPLADFNVLKKRRTIFRAEDHMDQKIRKRLRHSQNSDTGPHPLC